MFEVIQAIPEAPEGYFWMVCGQSNAMGQPHFKLITKGLPRKLKKWAKKHY